MKRELLILGLVGSSALIFMASRVVHHLTTGITCTNPSNRVKVIALNKGWNKISYFCDTEILVEDVFSDVWEDVIVINGFHDGGAVSANPNVPQKFWSLRKMRPGYGYWVKMTNPRQIDYNIICRLG